MWSPRLRRLTVRAGSLAVAGILIYLSLQGTDLAEIGQAFAQADYRWCTPLVLVTIASHFVRAWRWQILMAALPAATAKPRLATAFGSVMIGLMVNYVLPRAGEFVRTANLVQREKLPFSGVLGTVVTERILDLLALAAGIGLSLSVLTGPQRARLHAEMLMPALDQLAHVPIPTALVTLLFTAALAWYALSRSFMKRLTRQHIAPLWASFKGGMATAFHSPQRFLLFVTTIGIWPLYALMAYIPLEMFSVAGPLDLSLMDATVIMFVGVLGVIVPTPGGAGSFHYVTVLALTILYGVSGSLAATYAFFVHGAQLILYLAMGLMVIAFQDTKLAQLRRFAQWASQSDEQPA